MDISFYKTVGFKVMRARNFIHFIHSLQSLFRSIGSAGGLKVKTLTQIARDVGSSPPWCYPFPCLYIHFREKFISYIEILCLKPYLSVKVYHSWELSSCLLSVNTSLRVSLKANSSVRQLMTALALVKDM